MHHDLVTLISQEHTSSCDSRRSFTTANYDLTTSSCTEWAFVVAPDDPPEGGFPVEVKILQAKSEAGLRRKSLQASCGKGHEVA